MKIINKDILGVQVSAVNMKVAIQVFDYWIASKQKNYVCVTPAHSVMDCVNDPSLYSLFNGSGMTVPDGMAIAWLLKLKGEKDIERVAGSDLMETVLSYSSQKGWKHFFYGSTPETLKKLSTYFENQYPETQIVGTYSPPFRDLTKDEEESIIQKINAVKPNFVWVGIGSPKQEQWMAKHLDDLSASVLVGVGAAFDFLSGEKPRAPLWMQKMGLEWLFRFIIEPKRLWPRYRLYPRFVFLVFLQLLGLWKPES